VGLPLVVLLAGAVYSLSHLPGANAQMEHADDVRVAIEQLRTVTLEGETGMRGYLIAGDKTFLEPYTQAVTDWPGELDRVRGLTSDDPLEQHRLSRLEELIRRRFEMLDLQRMAFERGARGTALVASGAEGKRVMDEISGLLNDMEREEIGRDIDRRAAAVRRWELTMVLFVGGAFTSLVVLGAALIQRRSADARRTHAEQVARAIDDERHLLQAILSGMDDAITLHDRDGRLVFANRAAAAMMGFPSPEALLAASPVELAEHFEAFDESGEPFSIHDLPARTVLAGRGKKETSVVVRTRLRHPDDGAGDDRWCNIRSYPVLDARGELTQVINVFRDVSAERRDNDLRRLLMRATDELIASPDADGALATVARLLVPAVADWCAIDVGAGPEMRRMAVAGAEPSAATLQAARTRAADPTSGDGRPRLVRLPLSVGGRTVGVISLAMNAARPHGERELVFMQALADRTALAIENGRLFRENAEARVKLREQLIQETERRQDAESTTRFAEMFVGMLGHDLRNPLNAVSMTARLLKRKGGADPKAVERILSSADRMSNMVAQLLDLTRSRLAGGITIEKKPIHLGEIINEAVDELRLVHQQRNIRCEVRGDDRTLGDQGRLAQVVSNLVGNAVEHGDPSRPVTVTLSVSGDRLVLVVQNAGAPIPPELLRVIFDPFRRTTARGELAKGLGLGLFISQQIVLAHGGTIDVRSTVEEGTVFTVSLARLTDQKFPVADGTLVL
jgi:signal transduction histidine kinase/CHASE3 domain sensor protein